MGISWRSMPPRVRQLAQFVIAAALLGFAAATWLYVLDHLEGEPAPFLRTVAFVMPFWLLWAAYAPLVVWMSTNRPIERSRIVSRVLTHSGLAIALSLVHTLTRVGLQPGIHDLVRAARADVASWDPLFALVALELPVHLGIYGAISGGTYVFLYYRRLRERELAATRLSAQLAEARMQALRMQLNPHFLFNALNSVAMLVRDSRREAAVETLEGLSDLLRYVLEDSAGQEVKLEREIEFVERYLALEKIRFQDRLEVQIDVDRDSLQAMVPNLLLQPFVENAIKHGMSSRIAATTISVSAKVDGGALRLEISDDGPGFGGTAEAPLNPGVGISNARRRLAQLYGDRASIEVGELSPTGAAVTVLLPFHTTPFRDRELE